MFLSSSITQLRHLRACGGVAFAVAVLAGSVAPAEAARETPLVEAAKRADWPAIDTLLAQGVDVNEPGHDGTVALHWAAHHGDLETLIRLIDAGADVAATNRYGIAPIWLASQNGHTAVVDALLRAGVDPDSSRGTSGETVLMIAARGGHVEVLRRLVAQGAAVNAQERIRQQTALMWAAAEGHLAAVRLLAGFGADLEARSSTGMTPLMFAIRSGSIDVTRELLDQGAELKATAPDGTTMLVLAIINAHWELAAFLLDRGADPMRDDPQHGRPLHVLTFMRRAENRGLSAWLPRKPSGNIDTIELATRLLERGAEINDRVDWENGMRFPPHMALGMFPGVSFTGGTPFYIAAKQCDLEFMRFLLANGADPSIGTVHDVSPLLAAAGVGYTIGESPGTPEEALEAVQWLQTLGNDVRATMDEGASGSTGTLTGGSWAGASALHGAVIRGAEGLVKWLIDEGVPLDHRMRSGETALDLAEGSDLGITYHVQPALAAVIRDAMIAQGLDVHDRSARGHDDTVRAEVTR